MRTLFLIALAALTLVGCSTSHVVRSDLGPLALPAKQLPPTPPGASSLRIVGTKGAMAIAAAPGVPSVPSVILAWDANTETNLGGYKAHYGTAPRTYSNVLDVGNVTQVRITNLLEGVTYYFAATAYNTQGRESDYSNEVNHRTPDPAPAPPVGVRVFAAQAKVEAAPSLLGPYTQVAVFEFAQPMDELQKYYRTLLVLPTNGVPGN